MATYEPNMVLSNGDYRVIGTRPPRHDVVERVTGGALYGGDVHLPGQLYGKILRSPHAHAMVRSINVHKALQIPGVKAVVTSGDLAKVSREECDAGEHFESEGFVEDIGFLANNCLAGVKVLYRGHAVAAVAATTREIAEEALSQIEVDYQVLPPVMSAKEAMREGAPVLHDRLHDSSDTDGAAELPNVARRIEFQLGDLSKGFQDADVIVEREYRTVAVHQGYIEPHAATVMWGPDGMVTIWSSSQGHFMVRDETASIIGIPASKIKAIPMEIGGGFGGKTLVYLEPVAALLSRKTGRPVKLTMDRSEVFEGTGPTSGCTIRVKFGATSEGRLTAAEAHLVYEAGAFPGSAVGAACQCIFAPYDIPNMYVEGFDVVVNIPKSAAYRAPGAPAAAFAAETVVDELCDKLAIDPIEFRLLNGSKEGTRRVTGPQFRRIGNLETLEAIKSHPHYGSPVKGKNRGRGVASGFWFNVGGPSSATASVNADGTISLVEGSPDIGGTRTVVAMQLAEVLGIPVADVKPAVGDTDSIGFTSVTGGSSVAFKTGWACYEAAQDIISQMLARAAKIWDVDIANIEYRDGGVHHKTDPALALTFRELATQLMRTGGPIVGSATVDPRTAGGAFATHLVDVEVDTETGKVAILRYTAAQDAGKAIHPTYVEGQIQGGVAQGVGWALNEGYFFDEKGRMMNPTFLDYRMPVSLDLPMIDTVIVEVPNPGHPFGVRGVGEVPIIPPMAAIANAIYDAVGIRMTELPMSPQRVLEALRANSVHNPQAE